MLPWWRRYALLEYVSLLDLSDLRRQAVVARPFREGEGLVDGPRRLSVPALHNGPSK